MRDPMLGDPPTLVPQMRVANVPQKDAPASLDKTNEATRSDAMIDQANLGETDAIFEISGTTAGGRGPRDPRDNREGQPRREPRSFEQRPAATPPPAAPAQRNKAVSSVG